MLEAMVAEGDPVASAEAFVGAWESALADSDYCAGCPIVAATLGSSEVPAAARVAVNALRQWVRLIAGPVEQAGLGPRAAEELATVIMSLADSSSMPL